MIVQPSAAFVAALRSGGLVRNGTLSLVQTLVLVGALFLAYRVAIGEVGLERFGIWSLIVAGTALARLGDVSGGAALARFVARGGASAFERREIVHTVLLAGLVLNTLLAAAIVIAGPLALPLLLEPRHLPEAERLLPLAALLIVAGGAAGAVSAGIDGVHRADLRAACNIAGGLGFLAATHAWVPVFGMAGFGAALLLQQVGVIVLGWLTLRRFVPGLGWFPVRWRMAVFGETAGYALRLNAIGVMVMLFEPLAKLGFNGIGGPALVALYDIATRPAMQARGLIGSAMSPLVPRFAAEAEAAHPAARAVLRLAIRTVAAASVGMTLLLLAGMPLVSLFLLGEVSPDLLRLGAVAIGGAAISALPLPLISAAQGRGILRWTFVAQAGLALVVLAGTRLTVPGGDPLHLMAFVGGGLGVFALVAFAGNARALGAGAGGQGAAGAAAAASAALCALFLVGLGWGQ